MSENDLVDELRGFAGDTQSARASLMRDAADEIERLRGAGEWEYGVHLGATDEVRAHTSRRLAISDANGKSTITYPDGHVEEFDRALMRRRKAGPWQPVTGDDDA